MAARRYPAKGEIWRPQEGRRALGEYLQDRPSKRRRKVPLPATVHEAGPTTTWMMDAVGRVFTIPTMTIVREWIRIGARHLTGL